MEPFILVDIYLIMHGREYARSIANKLIADYKFGISTYKMQAIYDIYSADIKNVLLENNVEMRSNWKITDTIIPLGLHEKINGWLLGDGHLAFYGAQAKFSIVTKWEEYSDFIIKCFDDAHIRTRKYKQTDKKHPDNIYYRVVTQDLVELGKLYPKWYKDKIKFIPKDLQLTNDTVRYWAMDDGTKDQKKGHFRFCTNGFTIDDCDFLAAKLNEFVGSEKIHTIERHYHTTRIYLSRVDAIRMFQKIGPCNLECFKYKWHE